MPRRVVDVVGASPRSRAVDAAGFDWYDPIASHAMRMPGRRVPGSGGRGRDWSFGRALWDTVSDPAALGSWCATEAALRPGLPLWVVENGMATRVRDGRAEPREDGMDRPRYVREHLGAVADAVAAEVPVRAYLHWSLVDNYEWGSYEPRFGLYGLDRSDPAAVRWQDTDSAGDGRGRRVQPGAGRAEGAATVQSWTVRGEAQSFLPLNSSMSSAASPELPMMRFSLTRCRMTSTTTTRTMIPRST